VIRAVLATVLAAGVMAAQAPGVGLPPGAAIHQLTGPANLDFEAGGTARGPAEWSIAQDSRIEGYSSEARTEGCRTGRGCAVIVAGPAVKGGAGTLVQRFDATPYREKTMRLLAWVRLEGGRHGDRIRVLFTVDGEKKSAEYVQKSGVNEAEWTLAEVKGKVPKDAAEIHIGVTMSGKGTAWIDDVVFEAAP
jgi:hypothetical protein